MRDTQNLRERGGERDTKNLDHMEGGGERERGREKHKERETEKEREMER